MAKISGPSTMPVAPNTNRPPMAAMNTGTVCIDSLFFMSSG